MFKGIDDRELGLKWFSPVCSYCKHWKPEKVDLKNLKVGFCKAFPNGIPEEIWLGEDDHKKPYKGDNGIQFEEIE